MARVRIGAIGSGYWGPNVIRNFVEIPDSEVVAVADINPAELDRIRTRHPQIELATDDYTDLFSLDLDAVVICTPPHTHCTIATECMRQGLDVLIEKPMTTSAIDARNLIAVAESHERVLMVGHTFEYNPAVRALKSMMDEGILGDVHYIDAVRVGLGKYQKLNVVWDLAPHDISILLYLLEQMPEQVAGEAVACVHSDVEDVAYLTLRFAERTLAHVRLSWLDPSKTRRLTVVGSEKMVIYDDVEPNEKLKVFDKGVEALKTPDTFGEFQFNYRYGDIVAPFIDYHEPLRVQAEHFLDCVRDRTTPLTDGNSGLRIVAIIEALQRSLRSGGRPQQMVDPSVDPMPEPSNGHRDLEPFARASARR